PARKPHDTTGGGIGVSTGATNYATGRLRAAGLVDEALAALVRVGIVFSTSMLKALKEPTVVSFLNRFYSSPGFQNLVQDLVVSPNKKDRAVFAMRYALGRMDPKLAKFQQAADPPRRSRSAEAPVRRVDIVRTGQTARQGREINYELESWTKETREKAFKKS